MKLELASTVHAFKLGEGEGLRLVVEGVAQQHSVDCQGHHNLLAALVVHTDTSSQQCQIDIERASFHLLVALVQLLAAGDMHSFADHTHHVLLHDQDTCPQHSTTVLPSIAYLHATTRRYNIHCRDRYTE